MKTPNPSLRNFTSKKGEIESMIRRWNLDKGRMVITVKGVVIVDKYRGINLIK